MLGRWIKEEESEVLTETVRAIANKAVAAIKITL
jgi:hypothetical protein